MLAYQGPAFASHRHAAWDTREKGQRHRRSWKTEGVTTMGWHRRGHTTTHAESCANRACTVTYPSARDHVRMNRRACSENGTIAAGHVRPLCASWYDIDLPAITAPDAIAIPALC
jgi:hypothetical protein